MDEQEAPITCNPDSTQLDNIDVMNESGTRSGVTLTVPTMDNIALMDEREAPGNVDQGVEDEVQVGLPGGWVMPQVGEKSI